VIPAAPAQPAQASVAPAVQEKKDEPVKRARKKKETTEEEMDFQPPTPEDEAHFREGVAKVMPRIKEKADKVIAEMENVLGISLLDRPDFDERIPLHRAIHYMRFDPNYFNNCSMDELSTCELALSAHAAFVLSKENKWGSLSGMVARDVDNVVKLASQRCCAATVKEREAKALEIYPEVLKVRDDMDVYAITSDLCENLSKMYIQMDNSLKKVIDRRLAEMQKLGSGQPRI